MPTDTTVYNRKSDTVASILSEKHPTRASNATDAGTVANHTEWEYSGAVNVFDDNATRIPKVGNVFKPTTLDQVACLEVQVTRGLVTKTDLTP